MGEGGWYKRETEEVRASGDVVQSPIIGEHRLSHLNLSCRGITVSGMRWEHLASSRQNFAEEMFELYLVLGTSMSNAACHESF
jgi:hypothetical protein